MHTADFTPDLNRLEQDYQILTELGQSAESRTYLARHLELNRDVTIAVVSAASDSDRTTLARFEADVDRLRGLRHPNVIPVIEGRRLTADQFAVVRARVRGSSLTQLVSAVGAIPQQRVAGILDQVRAALEWARDNGLSDRHVAHDAIIFQQGSGRVLLSFDLAPGTDGTPSDDCDDARTIGSLSWEMLSGQQLDATELRSLADMRPDLSRAIVADTNALVHCWRGHPAPDIGAYVALLGARESATLAGRQHDTPVARMKAIDAPDAMAPVEVAPVEVAPAAAAPVVPVMPDPLPPPRHAVAAGRRPVTFGSMPVARRWGAGARFASAVAIILVLAALGYFLLVDRGRGVDRTAVSSNTNAGQAAGELGPRTVTDPSGLPPLSRVPTGAGSPSVAIPDVADDSLTAAPPALDPVEPRGPSVPVVPRHEPPRTTPALSFPMPGTGSAGDSTPNDELCGSPDSGDQHRCLMRAIDENDRTLNAVYDRLIVALEARAKRQPDDAESAAVEHLRSVQRNWLDVRDQRCHRAGTGPLYARDRAQCFASESALRTRELARQLESVRSGSPDTDSVIHPR